MSTIPITLTGTIATAPQGRTLPSGRACASFRLAVNHWRVDKTTGEFTNDSTSWFGVDCYGPLASNSATSLQPGMAIIVTGSLKIREWETADKSGQSPTVVAVHIGPDLRYGTANYIRAKSPDREQNPPISPTSAEAGQTGSGWASIATPALSDPTAINASEHAPAAGGGNSVSSDDSRGGGEPGNGSETGTEFHESEPPESASAPPVGETTTSGESDDADEIARVTAAASAPF